MTTATYSFNISNITKRGSWVRHRAWLRSVCICRMQAGS